MSDLFGGVVVEQYPFGSTQFSMATADLLADGSLQVISTDDGSPWQRFKPGAWYSAVVSDSRGEVLHHFLNPSPPERVRHPRDVRVASS